MKYAPKWPLKKGVDDIFEMYDNPNDLVKYHLKSLLLTMPGEKISDSNYGIGLRSFLFDQATDSLASNLRGVIFSQVSSYIPGISVQKIDVSDDPDMIDNNNLSISIVYSIPGFINNEIFEMELKSEETIGFY